MFRNRQGVVSIFVLILSVFFLTMGLTLLALHLGAFQDTRNILDANQVRYMAQTAVQEARNFSKYIDPSWSGTSDEFPFGPSGKQVGTYKYTITKSGNIYDITGIGYIPNSTAVKKMSYTLTHKMRNPNPEVLFSDGFESNSLSAWTGGESNDANVDWTVENVHPKNGSHNALAYRTASSGSNRVARLITPTFNLSGYDQVVIRFVVRETLGNPDSIKISQDGGSGFSTIYTNTSPSSTAYGRPAERVTVTTNLTATTRFRFEAQLDANEALAIDDVQIASPYAVYDSTVD